MTNLIIGLLVGVASAAALLWMWRTAERLRRDIEAADEKPREDGLPPRNRRADP